MSKEMLTKLATGLIAKIIRYAITAAGTSVAIASDGKEGVNVDQLATGIGIVVSALLWSMWEDWMKKRQAAQEQKAKANITPLVLCLVVGWIGAGCVTAPDGTRKLDVQRVANISGAAAELGAIAYLQKHPEGRIYFEAVVNGLAALDASGNYDPAAFARALQALPVKELKGPEGTLLVGAAIIAWDQLAAESARLDNSAWVKPVLLKVKDGLAKALVQTAPVQLP
jgi:hypothetical protein